MELIKLINDNRLSNYTLKILVKYQVIPCKMSVKTTKSNDVDKVTR